MTQPNQEFPDKAANSGSLTVYSQKTQSDWEGSYRAQQRAPWDDFAGNLFHGLETGISYTFSVISTLVKSLLRLDGTTFFATLEDALESLVNWVTDIPILGDIVQAFTGALGGLADLATWVASKGLATVQSAINQIGDILSGIFVTPINAAVGAVRDWWASLGPQVSGVVTKAQNIIESIVAGFTGLFGGGWGESDVQAAAAAIAQQQADTAAAVATLQQLNSGNAQGGNSAFVDFTTMADASTMGTNFDQYYTGTGVDTYGLVGGRVTVTPGTWNAGRVCRYVFNQKATLTDLQRVSVVLATVPGKRTFGPFSNIHSYAYNYIRARVAESGTYAGIDCVQVIFDIDSFDIGFVSGGVWTKWATVAHPFRAGAIYSLDAGSLGGPRQYKVLVNGSPIYLHNEVGTLSSMGSGYRKTGGGAEWVIGSDGAGGRFNTVPGALAAFYMADNTPPGMLLSIGRAFRGSSTVVSFNTQGIEYALPANFFDTFDYATNDLAWDGTAGTWTVTRKGNYAVNINMGNNNTTLSGVPSLYKNGGRIIVGNSGMYSTIAYTVPLLPGDVLSMKYFTVTANCRIYGDTVGAWTFFQVSRTSPDTLEDIAA